MLRSFLTTVILPVILALACVGALPAQTQTSGVYTAYGVRPTLDMPTLDSPTSSTAPSSNTIVDPMVKQASGCASGNCGMPGRNCNTPFFGCSNNLCVPGNTCCPGDDSTHCGRLINGIFTGICCIDPCYEPMWIPAANAAFFQDSPRPVTQTRFRWDAAFDYRLPDAAEFFWGKIGTKGPKNSTPGLRYGELDFYQEIAASKTASAFVEMTYRSIDSGTNPSSAGLGDMNVGAKSVILDRELLLITTQFRTYIPVGNFTSGLGTGHVALEPSLLSALKLAPETYLQTQIAYWLPLGGSPDFAGSIFHYHVSLNHNLYQHGDFLNIVGTIEVNGYTFRGQFTDFPTGTVVGLSGRSFANIGPGIRVQFCNRVDIGVGSAFGLNNGPGPDQIYRTELRLRF